MAAVAKNPKFAKKVGVPQSVGEDFLEADKGKKFRMGGTTNPMRAGINKQTTHHGMMQMPSASLKKFRGFKEGGAMANKLFKGKETFGEEKKEAQALRSGKISESGFVKGERSEGHKEENSKMLAKDIKSGKLTPTAYAKMEAKEPKGMKAGGTFRASANGIAKRGLTKGTMVKMCGGGMMKKTGRGR